MRDVSVNPLLHNAVGTGPYSNGLARTAPFFLKRSGAVNACADGERTTRPSAVPFVASATTQRACATRKKLLREAPHFTPIYRYFAQRRLSDGVVASIVRNKGFHSFIDGSLPFWMHESMSFMAAGLFPCAENSGGLHCVHRMT
ncbi:hypothetical protein PUN4_10010 [Paraburkholderia unamae]|nr:hypothetical protein PUN4_10010 [Paraburkholderia unamae]